MGARFGPGIFGEGGIVVWEEERGVGCWMAVGTSWGKEETPWGVTERPGIEGTGRRWRIGLFGGECVAGEWGKVSVW